MSSCVYLDEGVATPTMGVATPTMGVSMPSYRITQRDIDIEDITKFHQNRLKDLGARRVDDRHTHRHTHRQTNAGNNKGNPSDRAKSRKKQKQILRRTFIN